MLFTIFFINYECIFFIEIVKHLFKILYYIFRE